jgi:hypothetical protein
MMAASGQVLLATDSGGEGDAEVGQPGAPWPGVGRCGYASVRRDPGDQSYGEGGSSLHWSAGPREQSPVADPALIWEVCSPGPKVPARRP